MDDEQNQPSQLDFRAPRWLTPVPGSSTEPGQRRVVPPAWIREDDEVTVGYKPLGATSIGTESERRYHSRWSRLRVPADRLEKHHEERHPSSDGAHSKRMASLDKERITEALCSQLEVTSLQQTEILRAMELLDLRQFGRHKRIETVALIVIKVVVNYDRLTRNPDAERITEDESYKQLLDTYGLDLGDVMRISKTVKETLGEYGFFGVPSQHE